MNNWFCGDFLISKTIHISLFYSILRCCQLCGSKLVFFLGPIVLFFCYPSVVGALLVYYQSLLILALFHLSKLLHSFNSCFQLIFIIIASYCFSTLPGLLKSLRRYKSYALNLTRPQTNAIAIVGTHLMHILKEKAHYVKSCDNLEIWR